MGYDYSAVDGEAYFRLGLTESSLLYMLLDQAELLDLEAGPPSMPPPIEARYEKEPDDGAGPIEWELSEREVEYFGFGSADPAKVPLWKLQDSEPWIVTPREATVLADGIGRVLAGDVGTNAPPKVLEYLDDLLDRLGVDREERDADAELRTILNGFAEFCLEAGPQGGFWSY